MDELCRYVYRISSIYTFYQNMDTEMFTTEGGAIWKWHGKVQPVPSEFETKHKDFAVYKCAHAVKWFCRIALILAIMFIVLNLANTIIGAKKAVVTVKNMITGKDSFSQKEHLQYLGASMNSYRGDTEDNKDTLAAQAAAAAVRDATNIDAPAKFTNYRERMTPEEEAMKKMAA